MDSGWMKLSEAFRTQLYAGNPAPPRSFPLNLVQCLPLAGPYDPAPTSSLLPDNINEHHVDEFKLVETGSCIRRG